MTPTTSAQDSAADMSVAGTEPGAVKTVADLTAAHHGWLIKVADADPMLHHRTFVLGKGFGCGVRRWTRPDGTEAVGLVDETDKRPGIVGTERVYAPETPCELLRQVKRRRRR